MAREKKSVHKAQMTEGKRKIIRQLLEKYEIGSTKDTHEALKNLLGGTIKEMMEAEMVFPALKKRLRLLFLEQSTKDVLYIKLKTP